MDRHGFFQRLPDGSSRIQGRVGVLENDLHIFSHGSELVFFQVQNIGIPEKHLAGIGLNQTQDAPAHRTFTATGFTGKPKSLFFVDDKGNAFNCLDGICDAPGKTPFDPKMLGKVSDSQDWRFDWRVHSANLHSKIEYLVI
jgi:hypothetical protein